MNNSSLTFNQNQNLISLKALLSRKYGNNSESARIIESRIKQAQKDINTLKEYANIRNNGRVYDHCMFMAREYQSRLNEILKNTSYEGFMV